MNPIGRSGEDGAISKEQYTWRCDRANRANANACVPTVGVPNRYRWPGWASCVHTWSRHRFSRRACGASWKRCDCVRITEPVATVAARTDAERGKPGCPAMNGVAKALPCRANRPVESCRRSEVG
ncbi:MAG: hypothetical protein HC938_15565 [Nitrospira sp.]|nr:hypothetical protein [Nitrospira sp.]